MLPLALPGIVAGSIFTFSLTLGDYITPILVGNTQFIGNVVYRNVLGLSYNLPFAAAYAMVPLVVMAVYLALRPAHRRVRGALMEGRATRARARACGRSASSSSSGCRWRRSCSTPSTRRTSRAGRSPGFTLRWFRVAWQDAEARAALWLSLKAALLATGVALVLGTMAAAAVSRFRFFGREAISFLVILPLALPGVITRHRAVVLLLVLGRAVLALDDRDRARDLLRRRRLQQRRRPGCRRTSTSLTEASMDLGADGWQTFRFVTLPVLSTALISGALLAFALSFDEVIVTLFTAGAPEHAADLDPRQDPPRPAASGGERGRLLRDRG